MQPALLIECAPRAKNPIDAHMRNSIIISKECGWPLVTRRPEMKRHWPSQFKNLIICYASFYSDHKAITEFIKHNPDARLWWLTNEYNIGVNGYLLEAAPERKDGLSVIANFVESACPTKRFQNFYMLNLNVLFARPQNRRQNKKYEMVYFGSFRTGRTKYFAEYFDRNMMVSTSTKNMKKFRDCGCDTNFCGKFDWRYGKETLNLFKYSLYIEDEYTHDHYNCLANRFYEALFCNVVMFFDHNCQNTLTKAGLEVEDCFIVKSKEDLRRKIKAADKSYKTMQEKQAKWTEGLLAEKAEVLAELKKIVEG